MDPIHNEQVLLAAARWKARLHAADCSAADQKAFEAWLQADPRHAQAFALAERVTDGVDHIQLVDPRFKGLIDEALSERAPAPRRRWAIPASLVAGLACVLVTLRFVPDAARPAENALAFETDTQGRTLTLDDGSIVRLDVASELRVAMSPERREVELVSGRAVFEVAHDASRPFAVTAGAARTTALGTRFEVNLQQQQVVVTLVEGSVAVDHSIESRRWQEYLEPGEQLSIDVATAAHAKRTVDTSLVTSWTEGRLAFRGTPLRMALDEVNRYSNKKVRLGDPSLADLPVAGNFIVGDSDAVVIALTALLPLRVVQSGDEEVILFRRYDDTLH